MIPHGAGTDARAASGFEQGVVVAHALEEHAPGAGTGVGADDSGRRPADALEDLATLAKTRLGDKSDNDKLDDASLAAYADEVAWRRDSVARMRAMTSITLKGLVM